MKKRLISLFTAIALLCTLMTGMMGGMTASADESDSVLSPGKVDWVTASEELAYTDAGGNKISNPDGGYRYKSAYATVGCISAQPSNEGSYSDQRALYAIDSSAGQYNGISAGSFMGKKLTGAMTSDMAWAGGYAQYEVQGGSYIATALILHENIAGDFFDDEGNSKGNAAKKYGFQVSADGSSWQDVAPAVKLDGYGTSFWIYKAVVEIPEDCKYYRVVLPGFNSLEASTGWHNGADTYFWRVFIGPSIASSYNLSLCDTMADAPEWGDLTLSPGRIDWVTASEDLAYTDASNNKISNPDGGYRYKSTYATVGCISAQPTAEGNYSDQRALYAIDSSAGQYNGISAGSFMGKRLTGAMTSDMAWAGGYAQYRVKGGSYIATALILHENIAGDFFDSDGNSKGTATKVYGFQVSADGSSWQNVTATIKFEGYGTSFWIYKAVVQIPEDCKYYRVVLPGFNSLEASTGWHNGADDYFWRVFIGPSIASAHDLTKHDVTTTIPDSSDYIDIYKELKKAINDAEAINRNGYEDDEAMTAFVNKLAEAKDYLKEEHTHDEYIAMANALTEKKNALNLRQAPHQATIKQDDPKHTLLPGVADWLTGSALRGEDGTPSLGGNGIQSWYITYTDYATPGVLAKQDGVNGSPNAGIQISDYDFIRYDTISKLNYMGRPIKNVVNATRSWAACSMMYRVYAGSYVSTALIHESSDATLLDGFVIQTSADGEEWSNAENPSITPVPQEAETEYSVYKAVIKMPAGHTYYRVFLPGAQLIDPSTTWYAENPDFLSSFLGATISSMYDLTKYDNYADIPDATEYYGEKPLASTDEKKLIITDGYFKLQVDDMTIAQALALLDPATGSVRFYDVNGNPITDESTKLTAGMLAEVLDAKGHSLTDALGYPKYKVILGNDLISISKIDDIYLEYGAEKTAEGLQLPKTVNIEAGSGNYDATIEWDVAASEFDPKVTQTQQFVVKGKLVLPDGVSNNGGIDLTVEVNVIVGADTDMGIDIIDTERVKVDEENSILYVKKGMTLEELRKALKPVGDVNIVFYDADGEILEDESVAAADGMMLDVETDAVMFASYEIRLVADMGEAVIPETGVATSLGLLSLMLLSTAALLTLSKKRYVGCMSK